MVNSDAKCRNASKFNRNLQLSAIFCIRHVRYWPKADIEVISGKRSANDPKQTLFGAVRLLSPRSFRAISTTKFTNWEDIGEIIGIAASAESLIIVV